MSIELDDWAPLAGSARAVALLLQHVDKSRLRLAKYQIRSLKALLYRGCLLMRRHARLRRPLASHPLVGVAALDHLLALLAPELKFVVIYLPLADVYLFVIPLVLQGRAAIEEGTATATRVDLRPRQVDDGVFGFAPFVVNIDDRTLGGDPVGGQAASLV